MRRFTRFLEIENEYEKFYNTFYSQGKKPVYDTEKGIFGVSGTKNIYDFFVKIKLGKCKFLDLGSGDGKVVLIASLFGADATGIEFDKKLTQKSIEIKDKIGINAEFICGDFFIHDFSKYDIIFINPDQGMEKGLEEKLIKEMKPKAKLFIYNNIFLPSKLKKGKSYWFNSVPIIKYNNKK